MAYAKCGNASMAYKEAGYKVKSDGAIRVNASRMLTNANIQTRIEEIRKQIASEKIMTPIEMQERLTSIARREKQADDQYPSLHAVLKAMDLLGKMQGSFLTRQEVNVTGSINFGSIIERARERVKEIEVKLNAGDPI